MRGAWRGLVVHTAGVLGVAVVVDGASAVVFGEELLDFPIALFGADAEFEVFAGDGVPVLEAQLARFQDLRCSWRLTLYTIMTARRLHIVAKNRPSR